MTRRQNRRAGACTARMPAAMPTLIRAKPSSRSAPQRQGGDATSASTPDHRPRGADGWSRAPALPTASTPAEAAKARLTQRSRGQLGASSRWRPHAAPKAAPVRAPTVSRPVLLRATRTVPRNDVWSSHSPTISISTWTTNWIRSSTSSDSVALRHTDSTQGRRQRYPLSAGRSRPPAAAVSGSDTWPRSSSRLDQGGGAASGASAR